MDLSHRVAFDCCVGRLPKLHNVPLTPRCRIRAAADGATNNNTSGKSEVNISKYKSQRSIISADRRDLNAVEVNDLMIKAGKGVCSQSV